MQHDVENGVDGARAQLLAAGDEIAGGVVDQIVEGTVRPYRVHHLIDRLGVADIATMGFNLAVGLRRQILRGLGKHFLAASADNEMGAQFEETTTHGQAKPGAAARDQNAPTL